VTHTEFLTITAGSNIYVQWVLNG